MRAFLAIPLPPALRRAALEAGCAVLARSSGWRFVSEEALHLTVRFLGDIDPGRRAEFDPRWRLAARGTGSLDLVLAGTGVFPDARRPRVLWIGLVDRTPDAALARLAERVERAARDAGFAAERRAFAPHVTLARARTGAAGLAPPRPAAGPLGGFVADRLVLYRSELGPGGARYHEEASFPLAADAPS